MVLSIPLINIGVWLLLLKCGFALYNSKYYARDLARTSLGIQAMVLLLIATKYVELYSLTIFHLSDVNVRDLSYIAIIFALCTIYQLVCLNSRPNNLAAGLVVLSAINTGVVTYLSLLFS